MSAATRTPTTRPTTPAPEEEERPRLTLSVPQIVASALAAASSAAVAARLGVAGTLIGAAVGSIVATIGTAIYGHTLTRASMQLKSRTTTGKETNPAPEQPVADVRVVGEYAWPDTAAMAVVSPNPSPSPAPSSATRTTAPDVVTAALSVVRQRSLRRRIVVIAAAAFGVALLAITAVELLLGHPLSQDEGGTTISKVVRPAAPAPAPARTAPATADPTIAPEDVPSPTEAPTPTDVPAPPQRSTAPGAPAPSGGATTGAPNPAGSAIAPSPTR